MPTLKLKLPKPPPDHPSSSSPSQQNTTSPPAGSFTFSAPPPASIPSNAFAPATTADSPSAPAYSPITPKVQPVLPASIPNGAPTVVPPDTIAQPVTGTIAPAEYIPQPEPLPFSSEDSTDAIALRAAISSLQFQRKKAQDDLRVLEATKKAALDDPQHFRRELAGGRLREQRPQFGGVQAVLDAEDSDDDGEKEDDEAVLGADDAEMQDAPEERPAEIPDSQPSRPGTSSAAKPPLSELSRPPPADFSHIPGPQNIVRMPHVNWEKYHIVGEALDQMHEQQRRWPGSSFAYGQDRGREFAVAAPYSPFHDVLVGEDGRKDSATAAAGGNGTQMPSATGTVSEHPMETRRSSKNPPQ